MYTNTDLKALKVL